MEYRSNEIKAGIFILISLLILTAFLVIILGLGRWEEKLEYRSRFGYIGGIEEGSLVRFAGMEVGRVVGFSLPNSGGSQIEVIMEISKGTPIRSNSEAFLSSIGLMSAHHIEITAGTPDGPLLRPNSLISSKEVAGIAQMSGPMSDVTSQANILLKRLNDLLNDENRRNLSEMLQTLNRITDQNAGQTAALMANLNQLAANLNQTVLGVQSLIAANDSSVHNNMQQLQALLRDSQDLAKRMNSSLQNMDGAMTENRADLKQILDNSARLTRNLQEFSQSIKEQPWNLVRKSYPEERKLP
jgi:phospholipid/cholesterol/gamma-HCH transport system substrate-binding protein